MDAPRLTVRGISGLVKVLWQLGIHYPVDAKNLPTLEFEMNLHLIIRKTSTIAFFSETDSPDMLTLVDAMGVFIDQNKNVSLLDINKQDLMTPDVERELLNTVRTWRRACYGNNYIVTQAPLLMAFYKIAAQSLLAKDITK